MLLLLCLSSARNLPWLRRTHVTMPVLLCLTSMPCKTFYNLALPIGARGRPFSLIRVHSSLNLLCSFQFACLWFILPPS